MNLFLFQPGNSLFHNLSAGTKLIGLLLVSILIVWWSDLKVLAAALLVVTLSGWMLGPGLRVLRQQFKGPAIVLALLVSANAIFVGVEDAVRVGLRLSTLIIAAIWVTATTPSEEILHVFEIALRPFEKIGLINAAQVGFALSLTLTLIPLLMREAQRVRQAQLARGAGTSLTAFMTPLLVRVLKASDELTHALDARGFPGDNSR